MGIGRPARVTLPVCCLAKVFIAMSICPEFDTASILVVGDVMLDRFWSGGTDRVSPEAPVPVVRVNDNSCRAGTLRSILRHLVDGRP